MVTSAPPPRRLGAGVAAAPRASGTPARLPRTSCTRTIRHPQRDAVRDRGERLLAPVVDVAAEQLADEPLVRRRQQQRVAEARRARADSRSSTALCAGVLPRSSPASSTICSGSSPAASARRGALEQERGDVGDEVVVVRIGIGDARPQPDVRGDDGRVVRRGDREVVGIGEARDVVADHRAGVARGVEHRRAPGVDRDRHVEALVQRRDRGHDPVELLGLADLGPGPGLHAADVEQVGAVGDQLLGPAQERVEAPGRAAVVERVGRAVEDAHHERARAHVDAAVADADRRVRRDAHGGGYRARRRGPARRGRRTRPRAAAHPIASASSAPRRSRSSPTAAPARATVVTHAISTADGCCSTGASGGHHPADRAREHAVDADAPRPRARRAGWRAA